MTKDHPITPPDRLLSYWKEAIDDDFSPAHAEVEEILTQASRWGADQELAACCEWLELHYPHVYTTRLKRCRRPKPPSLKEQALETLRSMRIDPVVINGIDINAHVMNKYDIIRRALELLPD